ncbi:MAG: hypothetical protein EOM11_09955 [Erysipelotrichia bacterium]|nr:hypothetical protein [Erysipelotrichia bacterium]
MVEQVKNKEMRTTVTKSHYLTHEEFDDQLEKCLLIISEPSKRNPYYVCEHTATDMYKSVVHIYIKK